MSRRVHARSRAAVARLFVTALVARLLVVSPALASDPTEAADRHFSRGLEAARAGRMSVAASEFERAYASVPHYSVLYNLGLVYAALGKNADAVRVLRDYLSEGGDRLSANRRAEVQGIVDERSVGLASATLRVTPADAIVTLDARTLAPAEFAAPIVIDPGRHLLSVHRDGYRSRVYPVEAAPGETKELEVALEAIGPQAPPEKTVAFFARCAIPDAELSVNGDTASSRRLHAPLLVAPGTHRVRFSREGYQVDDRTVQIGGGEQLTCRLQPLAPLPSSLSGTLQIAAPPGARVSVDGAPFRGGAVPHGRHRVAVAHEHYVTWERDVEVPKGGTIRLVPELVATREHRLLQESIDSRRTWAIVSASTGLALLTGGVVLYAVNGERYEEWRADSQAFSTREASQSELKQEAAELQGRATSIQRLDDIAFAVGALGVASLGVGIGLYVTTPSSVGAGESFRVSVSGLKELRFSTVW